MTRILADPWPRGRLSSRACRFRIDLGVGLKGYGAIMLNRASLALVALSLSLSLSPHAAAATSLAPHKAIYDLTLAESREGGILGAEGRLVVELDDVCDDWASSERMVLRMTLGENAQGIFDYRFSAVEAKDGAAYRYTSATYLDGREIEGSKGRVATGPDGARTVFAEKPEPAEIALAPEARFPVGLLAEMLDAAVAGRPSYEGLLFDGVSVTPLTLGAAAISPLDADPAPPEGLQGLKRWRVAAAYFDPDEPAGRPEYEVSFDLYENGVAARMVMAYQDFTLNARLAEVVIRPSCAP